MDSQTVCNNNGVVDPGEECDMGNDTAACISCNFAVQLDLGLGTVEYFDLDTVIYFTESAELSLVLSPSRVSGLEPDFPWSLEMVGHYIIYYKPTTGQDP